MAFRKIVLCMLIMMALTIPYASAAENEDPPLQEGVELSAPEEVSLPAGEEVPMTSPQPAADSQVTEKTAQESASALDSPRRESTSWWDKLLGVFESGSESVGIMAHTVDVPPGETKEYIIGSGDAIGISVWRDDAMTRTVVVLPDGTISFPLIGDVVAGGKTVAQLKEYLKSKLSRYIADTDLTVEVKQSNSMIVYVIGRVNVPGRQVLFANTNVLQALAMAGGLNPFAKKDRVRVFRQDEGKTKMFTFDYSEVVEGRHLEANIELRRGDVIIVP
ncbi:MAG: polysaccharide export outer membrane [Geobacteraceae bacterium]|nr:MAG: polysaccharide export outer membrane [Geobacteraceae bacterium]